MTTPRTETRLPELPALTGIRFVAATLVFLQHATALPGMDWLARYRLFNVGTSGVAVFFVLSGFILTYNYASAFGEGVKAADYGRFVWDRLSRIYPLYLFTLVFCVPLQLAGHRNWSWAALGMNLSLTQCMVPVQQMKLTDYFNVPGWSISCEMLFYLLAPVFIWQSFRCQRLSRLLMLAGLLSACGWAIMGFVARDFLWPARFAPLRVPEFLIGVATAVGFLRARLASDRSGVFVAAGLVLLWGAAVGNDLVPRALQFGPLSDPGAALLIYGLAHSRGLPARILSHPWIVLLGMASYAFYLVHDPVMRIFKGILRHYQLTLAQPVIAAVASATLFVLLQLLSIWLYRKIEIPIQKRLRAIVRGRSPAQGPSIVPLPAGAGGGPEIKTPPPRVPT